MLPSRRVCYSPSQQTPDFSSNSALSSTAFINESPTISMNSSRPSVSRRHSPAQRERNPRCASHNGLKEKEIYPLALQPVSWYPTSTHEILKSFNPSIFNPQTRQLPSLTE